MKPRIYPSYQDNNLNAKGSLLLSIELYDQSGIENVNVYKNSVLQKKIFYSSELLYSIPIEINDVIQLTINDPSVSQTLKLNLDRYDYTTDLENNDNGIKITNIISNLVATGYTFTATTISNAYNFEYVFDNTVETNYQIRTELSQPILTENNEFINQQF